MSKKHYPNIENDLIKFLYKETNTREREVIVPTLFSDECLTAFFDELLDTKQQLDKLSVEDWIATSHIPKPNNKCVSNIMAHAKWQ